MKKGLFLYCSDKRTAFNFEKKLNEKFGFGIKEIFNDLADVGDNLETVMLIDQGDIPSDYPFRGKNFFILTHGMDFHRWQNFYQKNVDVIKIDDRLSCLSLKLISLGYEIKEKQVEKKTFLKSRSAFEKIEDNLKDGVMTFYSIKDGVGKTTLALNFAAYAKKQAPQTKVIVLDLDDSFSGIKEFVDKNSGISKVDLGVGSVLSTLGKEMYKHDRSGLFLITYKKDLNVSKTNTFLPNILKELKRTFDLIVIDTNSNLNDLLLTTINHSFLVFLITDHRNYIQRKTIELIKKTLPEQGLIVPNAYFIINKLRHRSSFLIGDFEKEHSLQVSGIIDYDNNISDYEDKKLIYSLGEGNRAMTDCFKNIFDATGFSSEKNIKSKFQDIFG